MVKKSDIYAVILAGGSGTRFWPLSRTQKPKQFLSLLGKDSLFQKAVKRASKSVVPKNIIVITNKQYARIVGSQLSGLKVPKSNILLEPEGKNTAPAICWAAFCIQKRNKNALMIVLPSDHLILNQKAFGQTIKRALVLAEKDYLVTLGIKPTRPETGYGYIKSKKKKLGVSSGYEVEKFIEKPNLKKAKSFFKQKLYSWNSGMFVWKNEVILKEFQKRLPKAYKAFCGTKNINAPEAIWKRLPSISIDYGIMEKAKKVAVIPTKSLGWSDLGSWESLKKILKKDRKGNIIKGDVLNLSAQNSLVWSQKRFVAVEGIENIIVVDTDDALLVCKADNSQKVRSIVESLKKKNRKKLL